MEAARELYYLNANIIITGRDLKKADAFISSLPKRDNSIIFYPADFSDLKNVEALVDNILQKTKTIDILINNAGGLIANYTSSAENLEQTMVGNHLCHFYLTSLLLPHLQS